MSGPIAPPAAGPACATGGGTARVRAAVAEPHRAQLLRLLLDGERCISQCVERTQLAQSLVWEHLGRLIDAGLVRRRQCGRRSYHSVVEPTPWDLLEPPTASGRRPTGGEPSKCDAPAARPRRGTDAGVERQRACPSTS